MTGQQHDLHKIEPNDPRGPEADDLQQTIKDLKFSVRKLNALNQQINDDFKTMDSRRNEAIEENRKLRAALKEIKEVAEVSEGVEFYSMLADKALKG
jgi:uncharacterized coiled-coil DUF342 family protein